MRKMHISLDQLDMRLYKIGDVTFESNPELQKITYLEYEEYVKKRADRAMDGMDGVANIGEAYFLVAEAYSIRRANEFLLEVEAEDALMDWMEDIPEYWENEEGAVA